MYVAFAPQTGSDTDYHLGQVTRTPETLDKACTDFQVYTLYICHFSAGQLSIKLFVLISTKQSSNFSPFTHTPLKKSQVSC